MPGGGSIQGMRTALSNNKQMLRPKNKFFKKPGRSDVSKKTTFRELRKKKELTYEERKLLIEKYQIEFRKSLIIFLSLIVLGCFFAGYLVYHYLNGTSPW